MRLSRYLGIGVVVASAGWCAISLRSDLASISLAPIWRAWNVLLLATILSLLNYALRVVRWRWYLSQLGHSLTLGFAALTYVAGFAFTLSPGKVGEVMRARYYAARGIPFADVAAAFCAERLMDLAAILALAALILTAVPSYGSAIWTAAVVIAAALVSLTILPWGKVAGVASSCHRLPRVLTGAAAAAASALIRARALLRPRSVILGFSIGLGAWALEGLGLNALGSMFSPAHLDVPVAVGIYAIAILVGALTFLPGGLGSTEAVMTALLATRGYSIADALLVTLACRIVTLWLAVCLGWMAVATLRRLPQ